MKPIFSQLWFAYPIPISLALMSSIPSQAVANILFSPHIGLGIFGFVASFPWFVGRMLFAYFLPARSEPRIDHRWILGLAAGYIPVSLICAYSAARAVSRVNPTSTFDVLPMLYFPISIPVW